MISISVLPIMQKNDYPTAGDVLYNLILQSIDEDKIILDMKDVSLMPSMFLNMFLGRLINEKGVSFVREKFTFSNIKASDANRIKEYVGRFQ